MIDFISKLFGFDIQEYRKFMNLCLGLTVGLAMIGAIVVFLLYYLIGYGSNKPVTEEFINFIDQLFALMAAISLLVFAYIGTVNITNKIKLTMICAFIPLGLALLYGIHGKVKEDVKTNRLNYSETQPNK